MANTVQLADADFSAEEVKSCCAALYESDWARLLLGDSFHPGGMALTKHLGATLGLRPGLRVLDVASGKGTSALALARVLSSKVGLGDLLALGGVVRLRRRAAQASAGVPDRPPGGAASCAGRARGCGGQAVAARAAVAGDGAGGGEGAPGVPRVLAAPHPALPRACRLVRMLGAVSAPRVSALLDAREDVPSCGSVARQRVGDHHARHIGETFEQRAPGFRGGPLVAPGLHEDSEHLPVLVDRPPASVRRAIDRDEDRVAVPLVTRRGPPTAHGSRVDRPERVAPLAHRLVGQEHPARGQQLRHVAVAQGTTAVPPHGVTADRWREPLAFVGGGGGLFFHAPRSAHPAACEAGKLP